MKVEELDKVYEGLGLRLESECQLIYMQGTLGLSSEIIFFEIEETEDDLVFQKKGITYIQLFPLNYTVDLVKSEIDGKDKNYSSIEIAKRLLDYRQRDA